MESLYGLYILLFLITGGAAIYLIIHNLRRENAALRLSLAASEQQLQDIINILSQPERERVDRELRRRTPHQSPPGLQATLARLAQQAEGDPYEFGIGWNMFQGTPDLVSMSLSDTSIYRTGHIAITGESGHGKGTLEQAILLQLARNTTTGQLRIQIIDPKSSDGALWIGKEHLWRAPVIGEDTDQIKATMAALREERQKRDKLRTTHRVREWYELPAEVQPPRLVVWITELETISSSLREFDSWLGDELAKARASGITYLIDLQNQSGNEMRWRKHIGTFIAGFQSSTHHIQPNIGLPPSEIIQLGAFLPTDLKRGQFVVRNKRDVTLACAPTVTTADIQQALALLPDQPEPEPAATATPIARDRRESEFMSSGSAVIDDLPITPELWAKIAAAAREVEATRPSPSRADVYRLVFAGGDPKATPTGDNYKRIKRVCDAERLLMPRIAPPMLSGVVDTV
ncbi:hypothetical protein F8S13_22430 [Chloroflexia bacterium SDU3-3]|nr:hypothetical protein F8S13_22430 [Chloroflexia bacterium SDU3-3]